MIIVRLTGGLGNQMFQYAAGRRLAHATGAELKLDLSAFALYESRQYDLGVFNITECFASKRDLSRFAQRAGVIGNLVSRVVPSRPAGRYFKERHFHFDSEVLGLPDDVYLSGYWQSEKYFRDIENIIRREFTVRTPQAGRNRELADLIGSCASVSIHIRRGDYITDPKVQSLHDVCGLDYYYRAIDLVAQKTKDPHFFVFSNDMEWVSKNLKVPYEVEFVGHNDGEHAYEDMRLMSQCSHHIIANSSFSWWGAWLNQKPDKIVVAPRRWFRTDELNFSDVVPDGWVKI